MPSKTLVEYVTATGFPAICMRASAFSTRANPVIHHLLRHTSNFFTCFLLRQSLAFRGLQGKREHQSGGDWTFRCQNPGELRQRDDDIRGRVSWAIFGLGLLDTLQPQEHCGDVRRAWIKSLVGPNSHQTRGLGNTRPHHWKPRNLGALQADNKNPQLKRLLLTK